VLAELHRMANRLDELLGSLEVPALRPADAVAVLAAASAVEQRAVALKTLVAERAADAGSWAREGHRSPEAWLAQTTGASYGEAAATLDASARLRELPAVDAAARTGTLSGPKLRTIATAATAENEQRLLAASARENLDRLRKTCAAEQAAARSAEAEQARHDRIHRQRTHRSWSDAEGAYCYEGRTTALVGARIEAAMGAETDRVFKAAHAEGRREPAAAYRADALATLICGGGARVDTTVVLRADIARLAGGKGRCEAVGTGPVPVDEAIGAILAGAFVKVVEHDGVDVMTVAHLGRHVPAELKTAVTERDGHACVRPGCGATQRLEMHHWRIDHAKGGPAAQWNLATLCSHDHDLVTYGGHRLEGGPGRWSWVPPP
jgi:hypothetical protein